jgi:hypothetical protein
MIEKFPDKWRARSTKHKIGVFSQTDTAVGTIAPDAMYNHSEALFEEVLCDRNLDNLRKVSKCDQRRQKAVVGQHLGATWTQMEPI